jgi:hypothetical protein
MFAVAHTDQGSIVIDYHQPWLRVCTQVLHTHFTRACRVESRQGALVRSAVSFVQRSSQSSALSPQSAVLVSPRQSSSVHPSVSNTRQSSSPTGDRLSSIYTSLCSHLTLQHTPIHPSNIPYTPTSSSPHHLPRSWQRCGRPIKRLAHSISTATAAVRPDDRRIVYCCTLHSTHYTNTTRTPYEHHTNNISPGHTCRNIRIHSSQCLSSAIRFAGRTRTPVRLPVSLRSPSVPQPRQSQLIWSRSRIPSTN